MQVVSILIKKMAEFDVLAILEVSCLSIICLLVYSNGYCVCAHITQKQLFSQFRGQHRFPFNVVKVRINRNSQNLFTMFSKDECFLLSVKSLGN